jgi:hypothetical protein
MCVSSKDWMYLLVCSVELEHEAALDPVKLYCIARARIKYYYVSGGFRSTIHRHEPGS